MICINTTNGKTSSRSCACLLIPYLLSFITRRGDRKERERKLPCVYSLIEQHFFLVLFTVFALMFVAVVTTRVVLT